FNRGGRGWGLFLALVSLIAYYLITLTGEQLARTGGVNILIAGSMPIVVTSIAIIWFFISQRLFLTRTIGNIFANVDFAAPFKSLTGLRKNTLLNLSTGIMDFDIIS